MIADFDEVFGEPDDEPILIPQEILEIINRELPDNMFCYKDSEKGFIVTPKLNKDLFINVELDPDELILERLKDIPKEKWTDYFYRTQQRVRVKEIRMGDEKKKIPIEQIGCNPLEESPKIVDNYMYPENFPNPFQLPLETPDGDKLVLEIQRQPYDSMDTMKFININYPAVKFEMFFNEVTPEKSTLTYSITPSKSKSVEDAVLVIKIFKCFQKGEVRVNGKKVFQTNIKAECIYMEQLDKWNEFWNCLRKLEQMLEVSFVPSTKLTREDALLLGQLEASLINGKEVKWNHPFEHFHVRKIDMGLGTFEDVIGREKVEFGFMEGPIEVSLMGADFQLFSKTLMRGFIITGIEWDDEEHTGGELYISDEGNEKWTLTRKYITNGKYLKQNEIKKK